MKPFIFRSIVFATVCLCTVFSNAIAAPDADDPGPALLATINGVIDLALGKTPAVIQERLPEIRAKMGDSFDTALIVQRAFGANWKKLTPAQQTEAVDLVSQLITRTYAVQLSTGVRPTITITASREIGPGKREIVSTASENGQTVNVIYRLYKDEKMGKWRVYDVLAEGVSIVGNYRQQFDAHFEKKSADELITMLKAKLAAPPAPPAPAKKS